MHVLLRVAFTALLCFSFLSTLLLYTYPIWKACSFPQQGTGGQAPFRLLALGDPQLEGDSSLISPHDPAFHSFSSLTSTLIQASSVSEWRDAFRQSIRALTFEDVPRYLKNVRKRLDLFGNDYYLAHIYRSLHFFVKPTHVTVLGDLLGSQWVDDAEFGRRAWRFWHRVFKGGQRVDDATMGSISVEWLGGDESWASTIINVAGNHDIGYSGDMSKENVDRFQLLFGKISWAIRYHLVRGTGGFSNDDGSMIPELWVVVLNSMNLDTPALHEDLQSQTYNFINNVITASYPVEDRTAATIVLTHVPLYKEAGVCTDGPFFDFYDYDEGGGLKEQNHLSSSASRGILEGIYGMSAKPDAPAHGLGRNGIVLNGHDHEGCDVYHHVAAYEDQEPSTIWTAERWSESSQKSNRSTPGIREVTVRSMMGDFGGNAGLLSAWFDEELQEWRFEYSTCPLGRQHLWWAVHVLDLAIVTVGLFYSIWRLVSFKARVLRIQPKPIRENEAVSDHLNVSVQSSSTEADRHSKHGLSRRIKSHT